MDSKIDVIVDVQDGEKVYTLKLAANEEQAKYLMEVGFRTLLSVGAIEVPDVAKVPTKSDIDSMSQVGDAYKKTLN